MVNRDVSAEHLSAQDQLSDAGYMLINELIPHSECTQITSKLPDLSSAGSRDLLDQFWCQRLAVRIKNALSQHLPELKTLSPIQCTLFSKTAKKNWLVPWHQDRSIPASERFSELGSTFRRTKGSQRFVQPSCQYLENVLAVRLHIDCSTLNNGPLKVLPRTHSMGILSASSIAGLCKTAAIPIIAEPGSVLVMRPLLVHASSKMTSYDNNSDHDCTKRRVLHYLFAQSF